MSEELSVIIRELEGAQDVGVQVGAEVGEVGIQVQAYGVEAGVQTERDLGDIVAMEAWVYIFLKNPYLSNSKISSKL